MPFGIPRQFAHMHSEIDPQNHENLVSRPDPYLETIEYLVIPPFPGSAITPKSWVPKEFANGTTISTCVHPIGILIFGSSEKQALFHPNKLSTHISLATIDPNVSSLSELTLHGLSASYAALRICPSLSGELS